jgi:hypothetical protein
MIPGNSFISELPEPYFPEQILIGICQLLCCQANAGIHALFVRRKAYRKIGPGVGNLRRPVERGKVRLDLKRHTFEEVKVKNKYEKLVFDGSYNSETNAAIAFTVIVRHAKDAIPYPAIFFIAVP